MLSIANKSKFAMIFRQFEYKIDYLNTPLNQVYFTHNHTDDNK